MVILVVHENRILALESKGQAPASVDPDRPVFFLALQRMQSPRQGLGHVVRALGAVKGSELLFQLGGMTRLNPGLAAGFEKLLQPSMAE